MTEEEAEQLKPGTLLCIRECMLNTKATESTLSLQSVADKDGYIYKFKEYQEGETFPVQATSLATGREMEFYVSEVEIAKEQDNDDTLLQ